MRGTVSGQEIQYHLQPEKISICSHAGPVGRVSNPTGRRIRRSRKVTGHLGFSETNQHHGAALLHGARRATSRIFYRGGSRKNTAAPPSELQDTLFMDSRPRSRLRSGQGCSRGTTYPSAICSGAGDVAAGRRFSEERHGLRAASASRRHLETRRRQLSVVHRHRIALRHCGAGTGSRRMGDA